MGGCMSNDRKDANQPDKAQTKISQTELRTAINRIFSEYDKDGSGSL